MTHIFSNFVDVKRSVKIPVFIGSGVTVDNLAQYSDADALIIGSHFKEAGNWSNEICEQRVATFMERYRNFS